MKTCSRCGKKKPIDECIVGRRVCRDCYLESKRISRAKYKKLNKEKVRDSERKYYERNKEKIRKYKKHHRIKNISREKEKQRKWYRKNKEQVKKKVTQWVERNRTHRRDWARKYFMDRRHGDMSYRILCNLRNRLWYAMRGTKKPVSIMRVIGCSIEFFKDYMEHQFQPGMSWDNYGYNGWHIDHIRPCASFDLRKKKEQIACFHYTNLQPLWAKENLQKGARTA